MSDEIAITPAQIELLEHINGAHGRAYVTIYVNPDIGCTVQVLSDNGNGGETVRGGSGKSFSEAWQRMTPWTQPRRQDAPEPSSVIEGERDDENT